MIRVFLNIVWPAFFIIGLFSLALTNSELREWIGTDPSLENKRLTMVRLLMLLCLVPVCFRGYKILNKVRRYGTKEEQIMNMRFREMMKSEGEFSKEAVEKFFPEIANEDKIK